MRIGCRRIHQSTVEQTTLVPGQSEAPDEKERRTESPAPDPIGRGLRERRRRKAENKLRPLGGHVWSDFVSSESRTGKAPINRLLPAGLNELYRKRPIRNARTKPMRIVPLRPGDQRQHRATCIGWSTAVSLDRFHGCIVA